MCVWLLVWDNQDLIMGTCFQSLYISIGKWSSSCDSYDTQHINTVWLCRCIIWMSICVCMNPRFLGSKSQQGNAVGVVCSCARWRSRTLLEHTYGCHGSPSSLLSYRNRDTFPRRSKCIILGRRKVSDHCFVLRQAWNSRWRYKPDWLRFMEIHLPALLPCL